MQLCEKHHRDLGVMMHSDHFRRRRHYSIQYLNHYIQCMTALNSLSCDSQGVATIHLKCFNDNNNVFRILIMWWQIFIGNSWQNLLAGSPCFPTVPISKLKVCESLQVQEWSTALHSNWLREMILSLPPSNCLLSRDNRERLMHNYETTSLVSDLSGLPPASMSVGVGENLKLAFHQWAGKWWDQLYPNVTSSYFVIMKLLWLFLHLLHLSREWTRLSCSIIMRTLVSPSCVHDGFGF